MAALVRLSQSGPLRSFVGAAMNRVAARGVAVATQETMEVEEFGVPFDLTKVDVDRIQKQVDEGRGPQYAFVGCPGVGKGTYASRLAKLLNVPHIAMGDLVREELNSKHASPLSAQLADIMTRGRLLPDDVIFNLLSRRLQQSGMSSSRERGFILDGFPRTINQAKVLDGITDIDLVVNLKLREDVLITKCLGRRICSECGGNFNLADVDLGGSNGDSEPKIFMPSLLPPPGCVDKMTIRPDDTEEAVKARLRVYHDESAPVEGFYRTKGKLLEFNVGAGGIPETLSSLVGALNIHEKASCASS